MAYEQEQPAGKRPDRILVPVHAQKAILDYTKKLIEKKKQFTDINNKFNAIDIAYARYKQKAANIDTSDGVDPLPESTVCCDVFADDDVTPPIVVSQVDSYVAYLAEVFLSGTPLFPVVSSPAKRQYAEQLEALIDDHASLGGYARQLLMFLRNCGKYNFAAIEVPWESIDQFTVLQDIAAPGAQKMGKKAKKFTKLKNLNVRNVIWDYSVPAGDVASEGDYAGYVERMTRTKLKRLMNKLTGDAQLLNGDKALESSCTINGYTPNYVENPSISNYITNTNNTTGVDWDAYFDPRETGKKRGPPITGQMYEVARFYCRVMPADFGIPAPGPDTPQIWKFITVNNQFVIQATRIISAYDYLPILFGSPMEDGMDYQTQSVAESEISFQDAASKLFNIRFAAARRAVSDRALYLPDMIKPSDINSPVAAPKIPVSISQLSNKTIKDAYHQIPFDMRGTESAIQDASLIVSFSKDLHGVNGPRQGNFQKGNKSVTEWNDTMGSSDGRLRLPALTLEHQVFSPMKSIISLNIFQYGDDVVLVSQATGNEMDIKIAELRSAVLGFKIADGYTPKSKIAGTDVVVAGMTMIMNSPMLQQAFGQMLPGMFIHFMSLSGVKGFEQYDPKNAAQAAPVAPMGLPVNDLAAQPVVPPANAAPVA